MLIILFVDAIFGFSFKPPLRGTWAAVIAELMTASAESRVPVVAVDIPSGWDVDKGKAPEALALLPSAIVSLSAPKLCAQHFDGPHYLGGRFVTPELKAKYSVKLPQYPGTSQFVRLDTLYAAKL